MEEFLLSAAQNYGFSGLLLIALVYIIGRFERYLNARDQRDEEFRKEFIAMAQKNTEAYTKFTTIFETRCLK